MQNSAQLSPSTAHKGAKLVSAGRIQTQHKPTELFDLSDELIGCILRNLTFPEKAAAHLVCRRFQNILSKPDLSLRIYGPLEINLGLELTNKVSAWELTRYLLRRAAGISDLEFSVNEIGMDASVPRNRSYLLTFLKVALPQLSAVFALHGNPLDLSLQQGAHILFEEPQQLPADQLMMGNPQLGTRFDTDYWQCLSATLRNLDLDIRDLPNQPVNLYWLSSMHRLQTLSVSGCSEELDMAPVLSLPILTSCSLRYFSTIGRLHVDCPLLAHLELEQIFHLQLPTGLEACNNLVRLLLSPSDAADREDIPALEALAAFIAGLPISVQELDLIDWRLTALPQEITALQSLRSLCLQRNELAALPQLPLSLEVLDLDDNAFTDIPVSLESMTGLRTLIISSQHNRGNLQIRRPLAPFLGLPTLEQLDVASQYWKTMGHSEANPYNVWTAESLQHLALAEYAIHTSASKLKLRY